MNDPLEAEGRWYEILTSLGVPAHYLTGKHGPCPLCGGRDRFRWTNKYERGLYICSGCGNGNGLTLLMKFKGWDRAGACAAVGIATGTHRKEKPPEGDPYPEAVSGVSTGATGIHQPIETILPSQALSFIKRVSDDPHLSAVDVRVAIVLVLATEHLRSIQIAAIAHLEIKTVQLALKRLEDREYVERGRANVPGMRGRRPTFYRAVIEELVPF